jgi:hypothetical protein
MIVTLDQEPLTHEFTPDATLQDVIATARATALGDRLVIAVRLDGQTLTDAQLETHLAQPVQADARVELETGDRVTLVRDALRGLAREFEQAAGKQTEVADKVSAGDVTAAMQDVGEFVQLWQTCQRALTECSGLLQQDLTTMSCDGRTVRGQLEELITQLTELRAALEARDLVLLADLLRYELPSVCASWRATLDGLADQVEAGPGAA